MTRQWWCTTCREERQEPVQCAPNRCYCNHKGCPAFHSWVDVRAEQRRHDIQLNTRMNDTWATRGEDTWIDKL